MGSLLGCSTNIAINPNDSGGCKQSNDNRKTHLNEQAIPDFHDQTREATETATGSVLPGSTPLSPGNLNTPQFNTPTRQTGRGPGVENRTADLIRTIPLPEDQKTHNINSSVVISDGNIVLCDQGNSKLYLFNGNDRIIDEMRLRSTPHNIAPLLEFEVAITFPQNNFIQIVKIQNNKFSDEIETMKSKPSCRGIAYIDGKLIYTTENDVVYLQRDDAQKVTCTIESSLPNPMSLNVDCETRDILVTCSGTKCLRGSVHKINVYNESHVVDLFYPEIGRPVWSTADVHRYIYICDIQPYGVHQIAPDGRYVRKLLRETDGRVQHINFIPATNTFIATEENSEYIKLYSF